MKKANVLCFMALMMLLQAAQAQILTGSQLNLTNTYTSPKTGNAVSSQWKLEFVSNNQMAFTNNGTQAFRMTGSSVYSELPLIADLGISSLSDITITGIAQSNGFIVGNNTTFASNWGGTWYGLSSGTNAPAMDEYAQISPVVLQGYGGVALRTGGGKFTIDRDGIVTIGLDDAKIASIAANTDNTHDYSLYVAKGIRSTRSRVDLTSNWPDFVFEKDYDLTPLDELETFIQKNHHLPNIPSAATVQAEGIDLGDMDAKLLQKIEELTLYVIELKKEIEALKAEKE